ncbi:hypothetical protein [Streptomyces sp. DI166]|uniref:hypothetical protein n=1 Tax=Streptomyces sp. DI166 TaxID=1839783 RepID=UPI00210030CF|nr:hypothetical protein [Streptomyces sp. DI166]
MFDLIGGKAADARCDVTLFGAGPQSGQDAPGEEPDRRDVLGVLDVGQMAVEPAWEGADVLVDRRQDAACHQGVFLNSGREVRTAG